MTPVQKQYIAGVAIIGAVLISLVIGEALFTTHGCKECPPGVTICRSGNLTEVQVLLNRQPVYRLFVIQHPMDASAEESFTDITTYSEGDDIYGRVGGESVDLFNQSFVKTGSLIIKNPVGAGAEITTKQEVNLPSTHIIMIVLGNSTRGIPIYNYGECVI